MALFVSGVSPRRVYDAKADKEDSGSLRFNQTSKGHAKVTAAALCNKVPIPGGTPKVYFGGLKNCQYHGAILLT